MPDIIPPSPLPRALSDDVLSQSSLSDQDWLDIASVDSESNNSESGSDDEQDHQSEVDSVVESIDGSWDGSSTDEGPENDTDIEQESDLPAADLVFNEPIYVKDVISVGNSEELVTTDAVNDSQVSEALAQSLSPTPELSRQYRSLTLSRQTDALATIRRHRMLSSSSQTPLFHSAANSIQLTFPDPLTTSDPSAHGHSLARTESAGSQDPVRETSFASTIPETLPDTVSLPDSFSSMDFSSPRLPLAPSSASPLRHALQIIILGSPASSPYHKVRLMEYVLRGASRAICPGGVHKEILTQETLCARSRAYAIDEPDSAEDQTKGVPQSILVLDCTGRSLEVPDMVSNVFIDLSGLTWLTLL
jgi:hypothetical protein